MYAGRRGMSTPRAGQREGEGKLPAMTSVHGYATVCSRCAGKP